MKKQILNFITIFILQQYLLSSHPFNIVFPADTTKKHPYAYNSEYKGSNPLITDIIHTNLYVTPIWDSSILIGKAEIILKPYFYPTNRVFLNARGMRINKITINDWKNKKNPIEFKYTYENDSIKIQLSKTIPATQTIVVNIDYVAQPEKISTGGSRAIQSDKGLYFINPKNEIPGKMPQIWTQGETQSNSVWFPTTDSPNEKMTHDIYITVDKKYTTLSNGILVESKLNKDNTKTDHWKMDLPHAPYLVMMGIGEFKKILDVPWKGKELSYYVEPQYAPYAKAIFGNTYKMINFFSERLGVDFPWQKYAQIVCRDYVSGAMENTSATLHGEFLYQTDRDTVGGVEKEDVISHELFHQWFGDLVTCESWSNLPLNESFATYGEYLWREYAYGRDAADEHHYHSGQGYLVGHKSPLDNPPLIRYFYKHREDMFDGISYNKGGQVLHMLRKLVGDSAFFQSLNLYLKQNMFKNTEIHHLRLAFEETTGQDLNWFFNQWFFYGGHPVLQIDKHYDEATKTLTLKVIQQQPKEYPIYRLPVYVDIYTPTGIERKFIDIQHAEQTFTFTINTNPLLVNFDAERQLLAEINYPKTDEEYMYQFEHAPLWLDRYEALTNLSKKIDYKQVYNFLIDKALKDNYKGIRREAVNTLKKVLTANDSILVNKLINLAKNDPSPTVRAEALSALSSIKSDEIINLFIHVLDKEYASQTISAALLGLSAINPSLTLHYAQKFEKDISKNIVRAILGIYAQSGSEKYWEFFKKHITTFTGFETFVYMSHLNTYLKHLNHSGTAIAAAKLLADYYQHTEKMGKFAIKKTITDLVKVWTEKEKKLTTALNSNKQNNEPTKDIEDQLQTVSQTLNNLNQINAQLK